VSVPDRVSARDAAAKVRENYTAVCHCEWDDSPLPERVATNPECVIHGTAGDPLAVLEAEAAGKQDEFDRMKREAQGLARRCGELRDRAERAEADRDAAHADAYKLGRAWREEMIANGSDPADAEEDVRETLEPGHWAALNDPRSRPTGPDMASRV
jgi:hypothetical protein